eukprot:3260939-Pleurochrysis_carterae.AAC.2
MTPDGKHVLTGLRDGTARVWHLDDGKHVRTPRWGAEPAACTCTRCAFFSRVNVYDASVSSWDPSLLRYCRAHKPLLIRLIKPQFPAQACSEHLQRTPLEENGLSRRTLRAALSTNHSQRWAVPRRLLTPQPSNNQLIARLIKHSPH